MKHFKLSHLGLPALIWFFLFLLGPLLLVLFTSFLTRGTYGGLVWNFSTQNYLRAFDWVYLKILWQSVKLATLTSGLCFLLAYPMAWFMATTSESKRFLCLLLITIPFLMNLIIRVYSVRLMTGYDGPLLAILKSLNWNGDAFQFSQNQFLVLYGMVTSYLPFMVFPLFVALEKFDYSLVEAHIDLGGSLPSALWKVLLPNTKPAIASGCLLVFVPCLGEFVIPDLLGGAKNMLAGNLITEQFLKTRDWPFGAALSMTLMGILFLSSTAFYRWGKK